MYAWLMAILLVGIFGAIGFATGAIRSLFSLVGALIALAVAGPLGGLIAPLFPKMGAEHPVWQFLLPPLVAFALVWLIIFGIGFAAHRPVELHFKYKEDDATRKGFEGLSHAVGLFLGLFTGIILLFAAGKRIYAAGYLTAQTSADSETGVISYITKIRQDMQGTGWDRAYAAVDDTSPTYYQVADILGLLYHNPLVHGRASTYPPFLSLSERSEFKEIAADADLLKALTSGGTFMEISGNTKIQAVVKNDELTQALLATDLADFRAYLETGKSPKYDDEKILGRWRFDPVTTFISAKRTRQNLTAAEVQQLRAAITNSWNMATATAYVDGKWVLNVPRPVEPAPKPAEDPNAQQPAPGQPFMDPAIARRYNLGRQPGAVPPPATRPAAAPSNVPKNQFLSADSSSEGKWTKIGDGYKIETKNQAGNDISVDANVTENARLVVPMPDLKLSFFFIRST